MSKAQEPSSGRFDGNVGSGDAVALGTPGFLNLAAAPTFAIMALWSGFSGVQPDALCTVLRGTMPFDGMTVMYLLMSVFALTPWLKLMSWSPSRRSPE